MGKSNNTFVNFIYNATYSLLSVIMPLITIPYVSRVLLADGAGEVAYAQNIVSYFIMFASLGIPNYGIREVAKCKDDVSERTKVFLEIIIIGISATVIAIALFGLTLFYVPEFEGSKLLLIVCGIALVFNIFNIDWFYRGIEQFKYITVRSYIVKLVSVACIFAFIREKNDLLLYAFILTLSTCINYIWNIVHVKSYINIGKKYNLEIRRHLKPILFLFATTVALDLYAQVDVSMLGYFCEPRNVAYYTNPRRVCVIITNIITAIGGVLLPQLSLYYIEGNITKISDIVNKTVEYILLVSIPATIGIILTSKEIVLLLLGDDFVPAIVTLRFLAMLIPALGVSCIFGTQLMVVLGQEKRLATTVFIGVLINILLNAIAIQEYQQNGAAFSSVVAQYIIMFVQIILNRKFVKLRLKKNFWRNIIIQSIFVSLGVWGVSKLSLGLTSKLIIEVFTGVLIYITSGCFLRNELVFMIIKKIRVK